ncbi:hypothetical protein KFL_008250020 [Klebsormidium nitens]|uniref:Uncharacterized protein n=1 Tax=Klebsormidium nitens TaxID=105231 RepID=A0A1Y1ITX6_KLENI|nr:hypothetical protein KFL_008250020 [Klebsormidium nitens]|eukprot:GAQ91648.1 hypothetical protein KFL_008250020 [Klebsormidium nitens]
MNELEGSVSRASLPLPFHTSLSSFASDVSAQLVELEIRCDAQPVPANKAGAKQRLLSGILVRHAGESLMEGGWRSGAEVVKGSVGRSSGNASVDWGIEGDACKVSMNCGLQIGGGQGTLGEVQSEIERTKAALTEFLEELGLKEWSATEKRESSAGGVGPGGLSRGAKVVKDLTACVEEHGKLRAQLQQLHAERGADETEESATESCSKSGDEEQAGSDLSFSNLVRRPGSAKGGAAGLQRVPGEVNCVRFEAGPVRQSGGSLEGDSVGLGINPGSVDCSLSEDTDVVVMSDSEGEAALEEGYVEGEEKSAGTSGANDERTAAGDEWSASGVLRKAGGDADERGVIGGMGRSGRRAQAEGSGGEMRGPEKVSIGERERTILARLQESEKRLQQLQREALADVATSHWSTGETTGAGGKDGGPDVAEIDWPEETRAAASQFLQAMTAHLAGLFEEYHSLLAATWHHGRPSDGGQVAPAEGAQVDSEAELKPSWDLLFSMEKLQMQAGGGALLAGPQTPPAGRVSGFELQSASTTPGSEPRGFSDQAPNPNAGAVSYRYADVMLGTSPESVACDGEPLRSALRSPTGKNVHSAAAAFASWAAAGPHFSDAGTQSELRELADASVQCDLALPLTRQLTNSQTGLEPSPLPASPRASSEKAPSASLRYPPTQQPLQNSERRTGSRRPALAPVSSNTMGVDSPRNSPKVGRKRASGVRNLDACGVSDARRWGAQKGEGSVDGDVLRRRCRTLECQVAALTGLLEAEKAERERLERWQDDMEKRVLSAPAAPAPSPVPNPEPGVPCSESGISLSPAGSDEVLEAELPRNRQTGAETRDVSAGMDMPSREGDAMASECVVRGGEGAYLGDAIKTRGEGIGEEYSEREAGGLVGGKGPGTSEPRCSEVDGEDRAGVEPGSLEAEGRRLAEDEPRNLEDGQRSVEGEPGSSKLVAGRPVEPGPGTGKAHRQRPGESATGDAEGRGLGELLGVVEKQNEELSRLREELERMQSEVQTREEVAREAPKVRGGVRLQEKRKGNGTEQETEQGTEAEQHPVREVGATRGAGGRGRAPETERTEGEQTLMRKSCGADEEGEQEEVGARDGAATKGERTSGTEERQNGTWGAEFTGSDKDGDKGGSSARQSSREVRAKDLGPEHDPQALEGLLSRLESSKSGECTLSFLLTLVRVCRALLAGGEKNDADGLEHGEEVKRVSGRAGKHQALLKVLEGAREQRRAAEAALSGLHVSAEAVEEATERRGPAKDSSGTDHVLRTASRRLGESHVAVVRLLTAVMTEVAHDVAARSNQWVGLSASKSGGGDLRGAGDVSGAVLGRSGEGLGGLLSGLGEGYSWLTDGLGTGLDGVLRCVRKRQEDARAVGTELGRELRSEVLNFCAVVGTEKEVGTTALNRLRTATDCVVEIFYPSDGSGGDTGMQRNGEGASGSRLKAGPSLRRETGEAAERQLEMATDFAMWAEVDELRELLNELRQEGDSLQQKSEEIRAQTSRAKEEAEREALELQRQAEKAGKLREREALERGGEKERAEKEIQGLKGEVWKTEAELRRIKGKVLKHREDLGSVEKECRRVVEERNVTAEETERLRERALSLKEEVKSAQTEVENERERARESRKEALAAAEEAGKSREKLRALEGLVQKATQAVQRLESDRKGLLERLRGTESALRRGEEEVLRVRQSVGEAEGKLSELEDEEREFWGRVDGSRREVEQLERRLAELGSEREVAERQLAEARAQLRKTAAEREPDSGQNGAGRGRNGAAEEEAGAALEEKLASLQGELMDVQVHLLASRRECQSQEERALRASQDADVARDELALLKKTALNARREAEEAQAQARAAGVALKAIKTRLEQMVSLNPRGRKEDGVTQEGSLADDSERELEAMGREGVSKEMVKVAEGIRGLEERVLQKEERVRVLEARVKAAIETVAAEEGKLKILREEARAMAEGVGKRRGQKLELEAKCEELTGQVRALTERLANESARLKLVENDVIGAGEDFERVKERVGAAEAKLRLVKEETEQAKGVYRRVKEEVREAKLELSKTRGEFRELERRWLGLKLEVTGAKSGVNGLKVKGIGSRRDGPETVGLDGGVSELDGFDGGSKGGGVNMLDGLRLSAPELLGSTSQNGGKGREKQTRQATTSVGQARVSADVHRTEERVRTPNESTTPLDVPSRSWDPLHRSDGSTLRTGPDGQQPRKAAASRSGRLTRTGETYEAGMATAEGAEAQLRVAQNGLGELLSQMHSLQERVARASESDESRKVSGRDVSRGDPLESLAEASLAACLEGVRQVHAQLKEACKSVPPGTDSEQSSATCQQEKLPRGRDVELRALEEVCGQMRADLWKLAERNEALRRVLRCGASERGVGLAGGSGEGKNEGTACSAMRPCVKCRSLNAKFLEISNEAARLRLLMKTLKARIVRLVRMVHELAAAEPLHSQSA